MHRNSQKRKYGEYIYFITCNIRGSYPYFKIEMLCDLWIEEIQLMKIKTNARLFAFCLNYDHFHILIKPDNKIANYSKVMQFFKRHTSRNINIILGYNEYFLKKFAHESTERILYPEGDIGQYRLRVHQLDEQVAGFRSDFVSKFGDNHNIPKFSWQKSFYDHIIRNKRDLDNHIKYILYNYSKHNLPDDWKYTGLKSPELLDDVEE